VNRTVVSIITISTLLVGCNAGGKITILDVSSPDITIKSSFKYGLYRFSDMNNITVMLYDGKLTKPDEALVIHTQWIPTNASTPITAEATNATVRYINFSGDDKKNVVVYSDAGYLYPNSPPGQDCLDASVWQANLRLTDSNKGSEGYFGQAQLRGNFTAKYDPGAMNQALNQLKRRVGRMLGNPPYVRTDNQ